MTHPLGFLAALRGRFRALARRDDVEQRLSEDVRFHLDMETEKNIRAGMSPDEARRAALVAFGGVSRMQEAHRDSRGTRVLEDAVADIRIGARALARTKGFVVVSVLTLAIAIGIGTTLFTAVNGLFFSPLPVPGGADLVRVFIANYSGGPRGGSSHADIASFSESLSGMAEITGEARMEAGIEVGEDVRMMPGRLVAPRYFSIMRVRPALGAFPGTAQPEDPAIVLAHAFWRRSFRSDPSVVGTRIQVNGNFFRIAAVAPPEYVGTNLEIASEYWIDAAFAPLVMPGEDILNRRGYRLFQPTVRLRDGVPLDALRARLDLTASRLFAEDPSSWKDEKGKPRRVSAYREMEARSEAGRSELLMLVGGVSAIGLVLLAIASMNLASLQMARAAARRQEIATRLALGASRGRLLRQLMTETALVAVPGALLGLVLAAVIGSVAMYLKPPGLPRIDLTADPRGLIFAAAAAIMALLVIGLMPALQSVRNDVITDLKATDRYGRGGIRVGGVRGGLIVVQVALSVAFTAASGLIVFALSRHSEANRFDSNGVMVAPVTVLPGAGDSVLAAARFQQVIARIGALPGITAASAARLVPNTGSRTQSDVTLAGGAVVPGVEANLVRPGYFGVIGVPIVGGRDFEDRDMTYSGTAAIVSQALAARLWPGENPLGKRFSDWRRPLEVVGVVGELRTNLPGGNTGGLLYVPLLPRNGDNLVVHLRASGPPESFAVSVGRELRQHNRYVAGSDVMTLSDYMDRALIAERTMAKAAAVLAVLQLLLAIAGLSGLVAYVTAQRRREIGIRAALGADSRSILALVLRQGVRLMGVGAVVGIVLSVAVGQVLATQLPVSVWIGIRAVLLAIGSSVIVAAIAMLMPARRALSVTPATALRVD